VIDADYAALLIYRLSHYHRILIRVMDDEHNKIGVCS